MRNALKVLFVVALAIPTLASAVILNTKHDLSAGSTAAVKFNVTVSSCEFCHVVHNAATQTALWARSAGTGTGYAVGTTTAGTTLPTTVNSENSKCMGCHDGTVALNQVVTAKFPSGTILAGSYTGTNGLVSATNMLTSTSTAQFGSLQGQHPVGVPYPGSTAYTIVSAAVTSGYNTPTATGCTSGGACLSGATEGAKIKLFGAAGTYSVECASCHEPHDNTNTKFLRTTTANRCASCHIK